MNITWKEIEKYSLDLAAQIKQDFKTDAIIGIGTGGFIPTTFLSKILKVKTVGAFSAHSYCDKKQCTLEVESEPKMDLKGKKVLLVDDLIDSGITMIEIKKRLLTKYKAREVRLAVYFVNKNHCKDYPDYWIKENEGWIVFPWENINLSN